MSCGSASTPRALKQTIRFYIFSMSVPGPLNRMPSPWEPNLVQSRQWLTRRDFYQRLANRYGPVFRMRFLYCGDIAVFTTSSAAKQILTPPRAVPRSGMEAMREGMGPHAVMLLNEDEHRHMRQPLSGGRRSSSASPWQRSPGILPARMR